MISQITYLFIAFLGSISVIIEQISLASLATCLLISGKIISPWQQLFTLRYAVVKNKRVKKSIHRLAGKTKIINLLLSPTSRGTKDERVVINEIHIKKVTGSKLQFECL